MKSVSPNLNLPEIDQRILKFWSENDSFKRSLEQRKNAEQYLFYDGPPFASGLPHYGHLLVGTVKDIIPRYQTMKGKYVERRFGWDTHGLPIEMIIEKELKLSGRTDILEYGVDKYNEACRAGVLRYVDEWERVCSKLGRWVDFKNDYKTMDADFMESVWWVFKQLWDSGRIYEGTRSMPYSWRLGTPLSNFEASSNYKDVQDPAVTIKFQMLESPDTYLLAWTTTPWTLPSNFALCLNPEVKYVKIKLTKDSNNYILAEALVESIIGEQEYETIGSYTGAELEGIKYQPLFSYFADHSDVAFKTITDSYVTTEDGTGIVHIAPAHGEDDHRLGLKNKLPIIDPTDSEGKYKADVSDFAGRNIKEAEKDVIAKLKKEDKLFKHETIQHSYPFCERSDTPLMHKAIPAWYVKVEDLRDKMRSNNNDIHWVPGHIKAGRFGKWLENARDWNISRNRFWGNPLPVWRCDNSECPETICVGSREELSRLSGQEVTDLHKHFVDKLFWKCEKCTSGTMKRIPEVLDCWFESGSMPYAQLHYPFKNKESFEAAFPADFIIESLDQTRGWFYTLMVLSTAIFKKTPFKNCIVTGMILAEDGKKMSKSLKNYPDPTKVMDTYGADALRLYLINSQLVRGESLRFKEQGVKQTIKEVFLPFWNAYSFFTTYANIDKYKPSKEIDQSSVPLDRWIISKLQTLLQSIEQEMTEYRLYNVVPNLLYFLEDLTNWYLRRSRRRFWGDDKQDKQSGYDTLYYVLAEFSKALAPFLPFLTEEIYLNLQSLKTDKPDSIHLCDYPKTNDAVMDKELENQMDLIKQTVSLGRALRAKVNIRTRQPLASITVVTKDEADAATLTEFTKHIQEELNVKEVLFSAEEADLVELVIKPDFPALGPIFGAKMKDLCKHLSLLEESSIADIEAGNAIEFDGKTIEASQINIQRKAKSADLEIETGAGVTVYFDTNITEALLQEGLAREFVNRVQRMRKEAGFEISDRINIMFDADETLATAVTSNAEYIKNETLSTELAKTSEFQNNEYIDDSDIEGSTVKIGLKRI